MKKKKQNTLNISVIFKVRAQEKCSEGQAFVQR